MVEALAEIIAWATAETATTMTTEVQEIGAQQKEVGEAAAAADLVAAVARAPPAAAQAATMVAALRVTAVTKVVEVLLDHLDDRMRPLSTVENLVVVAVWLTARVAEMMSACAAVAVGLKTVGTVVVSAKVEVLARASWCRPWARCTRLRAWRRSSCFWRSSSRTRWWHKWRYAGWRRSSGYTTQWSGGGSASV